MNGSDGLNIYAYLDYRKFLNDYVQSKKESGRPFSFRNFSRRAGINSPNYLQKAINGSRNLGGPTIEKFIGALSLKGDQAEYFRSLVAFNQTDEVVAKSGHVAKLEKIRKRRKRMNKNLNNSIRRNWWTLVVWELASCKDFQLTPQSVSIALEQRISETKAANSIQELLELGYLVKTDRPGIYKQLPIPSFSTDEIADVYVNAIHQTFLEFAGKCLRLPIEVREFQGMTIAISDKKRDWVKQKIKETATEILGELSCDTEADQVYRIQFQAFPITRKTKGDIRPWIPLTRDPVIHPVQKSDESA